MKAYRHLVRHAISKGYAVSVWDGEEWALQKSSEFKEVIDCIEAVEEAELKIRRANGEFLGWALVSAYGLDDDETVINWTDNDWMNNWWEAYEETLA